MTESSVLSDPKRIGSVLAQLTELGIGISLDDFGTGYSSLTHLKSLPVCELKLDRSFVAQMRTDATDAAIVSATIELARKLGIRVVAEGVEDEPTWTALNALGCERIQGYLLSRPVPAAEVERLMGPPAARGDRAPAPPTISNSGLTGAAPRAVVAGGNRSDASDQPRSSTRSRAITQSEAALEAAQVGRAHARGRPDLRREPAAHLVNRDRALRARGREHAGADPQRRAENQALFAVCLRGGQRRPERRG